ncbi:MAG: hypothetical protein ABIR59_01375 [Gemmatimonadales bacterium]
MSEFNLGWALRTSARIADATARSLGGTWAANLAPLMVSTAAPLVTPVGAARLTAAFEQRCTGQHPVAGQLRFQFEELAFALRSYPAVPPQQILPESQKVLRLTATLIDAALSDGAGFPSTRDLLTLRDAFATLAQVRAHTPDEAIRILGLRAQRHIDPTDRNTADRLFDLESR